jgi:hypothetical protein
MRASSCSNRRPLSWPLAAGMALLVALQPALAPAGDLFGEVLALPSAPGDGEADAASPDDEASLRPLPNQPIELCDAAGENCESQVTDSTGYYQFDDLESGTYTLKIPGSDGRLLESPVKVEEGAARELRILAK